MYKVAILGCENSHANHFLKAVIEDKLVTDVEFVGVYSYDREAAERLQEQFGVPVADSYEDFVGKVDGIVITARHGDNHYKYAKPYLDSGIPMFIDKPITCTEEDAKAFLTDLKARNVPVSGGSVCVLTDHVQKMRDMVKSEALGMVFGGYLRAPVVMNSPFGGFFFYSQHLVQVMTEIFGCYPISASARQVDEAVYCQVHYDAYDVDLTFVENSGVYYAGISCNDGYAGGDYSDEVTPCFAKEFMEFYALLQGKVQKQSYEDFFAPVYILSAIDRALKSGKEETINFLN